MPTAKLFTRQYQDENGNTYVIFRYWDNHLKNYEYQVYELKMAKPIARKLGAPDRNENGVKNNTRQMCDWVWQNSVESDGVYKTKKD